MEMLILIKKLKKEEENIVKIWKINKIWSQVKIGKFTSPWAKQMRIYVSKL